jgi:aryl-alcohol dehydrogenase-like predicted oxidoreductase
MLDAGIPIVSMQVQYSLLDARPENGLADLCVERGMRLLCYGALAGGFLSEAWLGKAEPTDITNRSLIKYKLIIDDFGGWALFQELLKSVQTIARKHDASIAAIATRWVLDRPGVAAVIVGSRYAHHLDSGCSRSRWTRTTARRSMPCWRAGKARAATPMRWSATAMVRTDVS